MNHLNSPSKSPLALLFMAQAAIFLVAVVIFISPARAGEGHDHGDAAPTAVGVGSPRVASHSDLFELVGIVDKGEMTVYLDRYASNEPVLGAKIEVQAGAVTAAALAQADGTYRFAHPVLTQVGSLPVSFTVIAGNQSDLLAGDLEIADPHASHAHDEAANQWFGGLSWLAYVGAGAIAALALLAAAFMAARRMRRPARV
jgi:membrane fusion protein, heavy metal efflux system